MESNRKLPTSLASPLESLTLLTGSYGSVVVEGVHRDTSLLSRTKKSGREVWTSDLDQYKV